MEKIKPVEFIGEIESYDFYPDDLPKRYENYARVTFLVKKEELRIRGGKYLITEFI